MAPPRRRHVTYVLPIKTSERADRSELTPYLEWLATKVAVIVVDGSNGTVFAAHAKAWGDFVTHLPVSSQTRNGKVAGVLDGIAAAQTPVVVVADDDVRYDAGSLAAVTARLAGCSAVVPQNYFSPLPWHARWDSARSLLNRAFAHDYAGTVALRRESILATSGYCGAVLFENLEMLRTLSARGYDVRHAADIFVRRRPPSFQHFLRQRVRQAYDSQAQPRRRGLELLVLPVLLAAGKWHRGALLALLVSVITAAEAGRRRDLGRAVFAWHIPLWAPAWLLERGICAWLALGTALRGGVSYTGWRFATAAHPVAALTSPGCPESLCSCDTPWVAKQAEQAGTRMKERS